MRFIMSDQTEDCCEYFQEGWGTIHLAAEMAARNGTPISVEAIRYCPWCGKSKTQESQSETPDGDLLDALELLVRDEGGGNDVVLCYDAEDGFWLASIERGSLGIHRAKDLDESKVRENVREAIRAAAQFEVDRRSRPRRFTGGI